MKHTRLPSILFDMYTKRFFMSAVLIPLLVICVGIVAAVFTISNVPIELILAIILPYTCFAGVMLVFCMNLSAKAVRRLAYRAPIILLLLQGVYIVVSFWLGISIAKDITGMGGIFIFCSTFIMIFGYLYVLIVEQGYISYMFNRHIKVHHPLYQESKACQLEA